MVEDLSNFPTDLTYKRNTTAANYHRQSKDSNCHQQAYLQKQGLTSKPQPINSIRFRSGRDVNY